MMRIKAIETSYQGYRFRSRTEARWAVFLDFLGVKWEYEKQGFVLANGEAYLPDFWLPDHQVWIEIKGEDPSEEELEKCRLLCHASYQSVLVFSGTPFSMGYGFIVSEHSGQIEARETYSAIMGRCAVWGEVIIDSCENIEASVSGNYAGRIDADHNPMNCNHVSASRSTDFYILNCILYSVRAATASRSARFEHGEKPTLPAFRSQETEG